MPNNILSFGALYSGIPNERIDIDYHIHFTLIHDYILPYLKNIVNQNKTA